MLAETVSNTPPVESAPPIDEASSRRVYLDIIKQTAPEQPLSPPETLEEAKQRILAARQVYDNLPPPEVDLPDTPPMDLKELLVEQQKQYWLDRNEVRDRQGKGPIMFVGINGTPYNNSIRIMSNSPPELPTPALDYGVAKSVLAGKIWTEVLNAHRLAGGGLNSMNELMTEDDRREMQAIMRGEARVEFSGGKAVLKRWDADAVSTAIFKEVSERHESWEERHRIMARSRKLRKILPFLVDVASSVRSPELIWDTFQVHALQQSVSLKRQNTVLHN